jgi:DNA-binding NarL/FixJ family response regulator
MPRPVGAILTAMPALPARRARVTPYEAACRADDPMTRLRALTLPFVAGVVPAPLVTFATVSRRLALDGTVVARQTGESTAPLRRLWPRYLERIEPLDPLAPRHVADTGATVLVLSDLGADAVPDVYAAHLEQLGAVDVACVYLRAAGSVAAAISLVRGEGDPRFGALEAMRLRRVQPLLEQACVSGQASGSPGAPATLAAGGLTPREVEVAELVATGARNAEIALRLGMSPATVKTHLTQIYAKLGVRSRTQLAIAMRSESRALEPTA